MARYKLLVLTNAVPGRDDEFNRWYNEQHIPDALDVPGFAAAQRFALAPEQMPGAAPGRWRYLAIYDIESDSLKATMTESMSRAGTARMPQSDAADHSSSAIFA